MLKVNVYASLMHDVQFVQLERFRLEVCPKFPSLYRVEFVLDSIRHDSAQPTQDYLVLLLSRLTWILVDHTQCRLLLDLSFTPVVK